MRQKETGNKKTIACFFLYFFLVLDGRDGQRRWHVSDPWEGRPPRTVNLATRSVLLRLCCYVFFLFPFLLNLYIEAGLVYRTLSLQKDRVGNPGQKGQESRTFPPQLPKRRSHEFATVPIPLLPYFPPSPPLWWRAAQTWEFEKLSCRWIVRRLAGGSAGSPQSVHAKWRPVPF